MISEIEKYQLEHKVFVSERIKDVAMSSTLKDNNVAVVGAAGSVGAAIIRLLIEYRVKRIILIDQDDVGLYEVYRSLKTSENIEIKPVLNNMIIFDDLFEIIEKNDIDLIINCAGYKVVPLLEENGKSAILNNITVLNNLFEVAGRLKVKKVILASSFEAHMPINIMGMTKKLAEIVMQYYSAKYSSTQYNAIRFGFVPFSKGAVGLFFVNQILNESKVTITDSRIRKYMCSLQDAAKAVLSLYSLNSSGLVYSLDMGEQILLMDVVNKIMEHYGVKKDIVCIGLRPGDKLEEEPYTGEYGVEKTNYDNIYITKTVDYTYTDLNNIIKEIDKLKEYNGDSFNVWFKEKFANIVLQ